MGLVSGAVRHYCLGKCSALVVCARRSPPGRGGWGRCKVLCLPRFPLPAPRFPRCVWLAVPSGCPLSSLAGTPFNALCAFRGLGPVALLVLPACPMPVRALVLSLRSRPNPLSGLVWRAHLARFRCWALVGPFHAVRAPPRGLPRSCDLSGFLGGRGGGPVPFPACLAWGCVPPFGQTHGACGRGCGCGGCRRVDPSPNPKRALLRAGFTRCGGGTRTPGGGAPLAWVWGVQGRALSHPRPPVLWGVRAWPTTDRLWLRGLQAWGPVIKPTARTLASWLCPLWGWRKSARGGRLLPGCGASGVGRSPTADRPVFQGVRPGPTAHWPWMRGVRVWGPVTKPTAWALGSWLCAPWGRHEGARGLRPLPGCGASGIGRSLTPDRPSFGACVRGPLRTGCGCMGCGRGDPSPTPQRALLRAGFARRGSTTRALGRGASCMGVGRPGSGALPPPTARPLGRAAEARYPLAVGPGATGVWARHQPHSARSCKLAWRAVGAARGRPGGGASCLVVGRPVSGALPGLMARPVGRPARAHHRLPEGEGAAGMGTRHQTHSAHSCELALRAVGAVRGRPGGAPLAWLWGVQGRALCQHRPPVL